MLEQIVNDQVTALDNSVFLKLIDEGFEAGEAIEVVDSLDFEEVLAN